AAADYSHAKNGRTESTPCVTLQRNNCGIVGFLEFQMSEQLLLQGKILGIEEFLLSGAPDPHGGPGSRSGGEELLAGRAQWITLLSEALPRALLNELGLARILLGSSGGGQFLVVLPDTARAAAEEFLLGARRHIAELSRGHLPLPWS